MFVFCEVAHNPPAYLRSGDKLAWHARFNNGSVEVAAGELDDRDCDYKMEGDHSVISNFSRILNYGKDPHLVSLAQDRLARLSRWKLHGEMSDHPVLAVVLRSMHDAMAYRTMPRFTFMTPEWVSSARFILSSRATSEKYAESIKGIQYTFSEEFINTPAYAFPDGSHGGFWARFDHGEVAVGAGPLPDDLGPADQLTKGEYVPVVPVGRTVNASMTEEEQLEQNEYYQNLKLEAEREYEENKDALLAEFQYSSSMEEGMNSKVTRLAIAPSVFALYHINKIIFQK